MIVLAMLARPTGGEGVKSGPIGLAVILLLCVAAYFLFKSMSKHLKRVRENFPSDEPGSANEATQLPDAPESPATAEDPAQSEPRGPNSEASP